MEHAVLSISDFQMSSVPFMIRKSAGLFYPSITGERTCSHGCYTLLQPLDMTNRMFSLVLYYYRLRARYCFPKLL